MFTKISEILNTFSSQWALILSNGKVVDTNADNALLRKMVKVLKTIINDIEIDNVFIVDKLIIFRISFSLFVFVYGNPSKKIVKEKFSRIASLYEETLQDQDNSLVSDSSEIEIKLIAFSMALNAGPTPIAHIPDDFEDDSVFKVCMKTMLLLQIESEGANKTMISFQPFIDLNSIGLICLFQIDDLDARGEAYDAAITVLIDYESRALLYDNYTYIEKVLIQSKNQILNEYDNNSKDYRGVLKDLRNRINHITLNDVEREDIRYDMIKQIKKLTNL
ncbi:MAG: hypothetical protein GF317_24985 [Candidatus Lokiarchaeota archaeon]|nr:hypothetical protein [Candidatus Lokiarchaeota archaeon]